MLGKIPANLSADGWTSGKNVSMSVLKPFHVKDFFKTSLFRFTTKFLNVVPSKCVIFPQLKKKIACIRPSFLYYLL